MTGKEYAAIYDRLVDFLLVGERRILDARLRGGRHASRLVARLHWLDARWHEGADFRKAPRAQEAMVARDLCEVARVALAEGWEPTEGEERLLREQAKVATGKGTA